MAIVIERVFDALRERVWKAWTGPEHVAQWWGPRELTTRVDELDPQPGGNWGYVMLGPDGSEHPQKGIFREVVAPETIVTSAVFEEGSDLPQEVVLTYRFDDLGDKTKLTMRHAQSSAEVRSKQWEKGVAQGWGSNFDSRDDYLATLAL